MPAPLDYRTLFLASGIVSASLLMFLALQIRRPFPGFVRIVVAIDMVTAAIIAADLRGYVSDALWIVQVMALSGFALIDSGIRLFCATPRRGQWPFMYVLAAILLQTILFLTRPLYLRIIVNSLLAIPIFIDTALPLLREPPTGLRFAYRFAATAFLVGCVASCFRIWAALLLREETTPYFSASPANTVFFILVMFLVLTLAFGTIALIHERLTAELSAEHSKKTQLERHLAKSERLAALGRLSGGIAHFFNNQMQIIQMACTLQRQSLATGDTSPAMIAQIERVSRHTAEITRRLRLFAQSAALRPSQLNLSQFIKEILPELCAAASEKVEITTYLHCETATVELDPDMLKETLFILIRNAREAMPQGGRVVISLCNEELDPLCAKQLGLESGSFVSMSIADTGLGMDDDIQRHLFEPFFTTKGLAHGDGLGLATVFGYIHQSGGTITVESRPKQGSTFRLHLPTHYFPTAA